MKVGYSSIAAEYSEGHDYGTQWATQDVANSIPSSAELARLREETRTESRRLRAFYLGALRGYRQIVRTERAGRWGT